MQQFAADFALVDRWLGLGDPVESDSHPDRVRMIFELAFEDQAATLPIERGRIAVGECVER
ncbi:MAG TPA: hypothetical protein VL326_05095 [Kofleriaceae bacterium]|nr:hypothetical protein [Kofleriaceae bacterium]